MRDRMRMYTISKSATIGKLLFSAIAFLFCFAVADPAAAIAGSIVFLWLIWWGLEMGD
jgi:hypothetical protein